MLRMAGLVRTRDGGRGRASACLRGSTPLVILLALVVGLAFQGTRGLAETSETRYAEVAREMLASGDWLEPTLEGRPHWTKPPLAYWCMAAGMKLCGVGAWGARLPGTLALVAAAWAVLCIARRLWGEREGRVAAIAFALGFPAFGAHVATTDIYLLAAETLAMACAVRAYSDPSTRLRRTCAMWAWFGVAFLVKGPPGLLPLLALIPWNRMQPRERRLPLASPAGLACFALVALPWYLLMVARHPELLEYFVGTEVVGRLASEAGHNRAWYKAFEVYGPALLGAAGLFGPWALWIAWRNGALRTERWVALWRARDERLLLVGWIALPLAVFTLSRSKLPLYVLPLAAPSALLAGRVLARHASAASLRNTAIAGFAIVVAAKGVGAALPNPRDMHALASRVEAELDTLPEGATVVLWNAPGNHGLGFHLAAHGRPGPTHAAPEDAADGILHAWSAGLHPQGLLFVVAQAQRASLDDAARPLGLQERSVGDWHILVLQPRTARLGPTAHCPVYLTAASCSSPSMARPSASPTR